MAHTTFDEFIERKLAQDVSVDNAWAVMKHEWLQQVERFFETVQDLLRPYTDQGKVSISFGEETVFEEHIGEYSVKTATVRICSSEVKFEPMGTYLIGAKGRVDMIGPYGRIRFLLVDEALTGPRIYKGGVRRVKADAEIRLAWKIATDPPHIEYFNLNENSFFDALIEVANA